MADARALGFQFPSPAYLFGLIVFGLIGYVAYRRGRSTGRASLTWVGVATMLYPYAVSQTWLLWLIGAAATGWICFDWN